MEGGQWGSVCKLYFGLGDLVWDNIVQAGWGLGSAMVILMIFFGSKLRLCRSLAKRRGKNEVGPKKNQ